MGDFKKLLVWQKAHALAVSVTRIASGVRSPAFSSLRSQMIRAAMSVDANIAEGRGFQTDREFARYLRIAANSCYELEAHLIMARDVGSLRNRDFIQIMGQLIEVRRMLFGLIKYLNRPTPVC